MTVQMEAKLFRTPRPPAEKGGLTPERVRLHVYRQQLIILYHSQLPAHHTVVE